MRRRFDYWVELRFAAAQGYRLLFFDGDVQDVAAEPLDDATDRLACKAVVGPIAVANLVERPGWSGSRTAKPRPGTEGDTARIFADAAGVSRAVPTYHPSPRRLPA